MKTRKKFFFLGVTLLILAGTAVLFFSGSKSQNDFLFLENPERSCTVILVGKDASTDGSTMGHPFSRLWCLRLDLETHPGRGL